MDIPDFFGLDIGSNYLQAAELKRRNKNIDLRHFGKLDIEENIIEDSSDATMKSVAEKIKKLRKSSGIGTTNCVIAIPEAPIFSRLIDLPKVDDTNLDEAVSWELKPLIPVPISDVDIAYLEVGEKIINDKKMVDIFAVAAPKTLTERFKRLADLAGLNLLAIETKALSLARIVEHNYGTEADDVIIFQFDEAGTDLVLARNGVPVFTQSISTGANALTKAIAADYGIDEEQAEQYVAAFGLDPNKGDGKIARSLEPIMQILINEVTRTLTYFRERLGDGGTTKLYICGTGASVPFISEYIGTAVKINSTIVNPVANVNAPNNLKAELNEMNPSSFAVAFGLGIKDR